MHRSRRAAGPSSGSDADVDWCDAQLGSQMGPRQASALIKAFEDE